ncbi:LysR substrate-binding domain-containing protein [Aquabacter sp. CN5-332]
MLDLDLLRAFVSVVDAGGFTRAGERVHRTQSTVSQQIKRLEENAGRPLFLREGRKVRLTEDGERLLGYARRILALSAEAKAALGKAAPVMVRLGIPDDFAMVSLTQAVAAFAAARPEVRLAVRCAVSCDLSADLARGELDVALYKREPNLGPALATWPERPVWIASAHNPLPPLDPVPLVAFTQGCIYRNRAIHALEGAGLSWRVAYESPNLMGLQAALACGLGIALLERRTVMPEHRILGTRDGLPPVPATELALGVAEGAGPAAHDLAAALARFCGDAQALAA